MMKESREETRPGVKVLGSHIDAVSWSEVLSTISLWAAHRESRYICLCNVHSIVTAKQNNAFNSIINGADMAIPDGMPIAWMLRARGFPDQRRLNGPDVMWELCAKASRSGLPVYLYGAASDVLGSLGRRLQHAFPELEIAGAYSPPFRPLSEDEDRRIVEEINRSGAGIVFVGLGCPKQEQWMAAHRGQVQATMIGVGAAFDFHAGVLRRAPVWMQRAGLEWLYRLLTEPRRLWRRYLYNNSLFLYYVVRDCLRGKEDARRISETKR